MRRMDMMNRWQGGYGGFGGSDGPFGRRNYFRDFDDWFWYLDLIEIATYLILIKELFLIYKNAVCQAMCI